MQELKEKLWREVGLAVWLILPNLNVLVEKNWWCLFQRTGGAFSSSKLIRGEKLGAMNKLLALWRYSLTDWARSSLILMLLTLMILMA